MASASSEMSRFSVKIYVNPWDSIMLSQHGMGRIRTLEYVQWGNVTEEGGNVWTPRIGRITWHLLWIFDTETGLGRIYARFTMEFDSGQFAGKTVEGNAVSDVISVPTGGAAVIEGRFTGHGDMHVKGNVEPVEVGSACAFIGYSW